MMSHRNLRDSSETQLERERDLYWGRWPKEPDDKEEQWAIDKAVEDME